MKHVITFIVLVTLWSCNTPKESSEQDSNIELTTLDGEPINLGDMKGKVVFVNIWATWCKPCIEEMPSIANAKKMLDGKPIEFLFASDEDAKRVRSFGQKRGLDLNFVTINNLTELGVQALPTTIIIDTTGKTVFNEVGYRQWDDAANIEFLTKLIESRE